MKKILIFLFAITFANAQTKHLITTAEKQLIKSIPLSLKLTGTTVGNPITGDVEFLDNVSIFRGKTLFQGVQDNFDSVGFRRLNSGTESFIGIQTEENKVEIVDYTDANNYSIVSTGSILVKYASYVTAIDLISEANSRVIIVGTSPLSRGIGGFSNFSANITDLDYTQKIYVDTKVSKGVNNPTTVVLTSAQLNSQYPTATTGFKVYCTSIVAGKVIYEKTPMQWIGMTVFTP